MTIIRASGFAGALAIHGLLLAAVPQPQATNLSSGSFNASNIALSISYQQISTPLAAPAEERPSFSPSKKEQSKAVTKKPTQTEAKRSPVKSTPNANPSIEKNTDKPSTETQIAVQDTLTNPLSHGDNAVQQEIKKTKAEVLEELLVKAPSTVVARAETSPDSSTAEGIHQNIITKPLFATSPTPPKYPSIARKRGQQGTVWIDIMINNKGQQTDTEIFQSSGISPLDRAALKAVKQWQFIAHRDNNIAVASRIRIPVEFSLE